MTVGNWNGTRDAWAPDGLPPMAEGSRWDEATGKSLDTDGGECRTTHHKTLECSSFYGFVQLEMADVRHVLARHDRDNGVYWRDRVRELVAELEAEAKRLADASNDTVKLSSYGRSDAWGQHLATLRAVRALREFLEEVPG